METSISQTLRLRSTRAFTLIELLTVITIIAVLAGILIPAVSSVRRNAKEVEGVSNLRQVGVAINLFTTENKNRLPPAVTSQSDYARILAPYFGADGDTWAEVSEAERSEVFKDPMAEDQDAVYHFGANPNFMPDIQTWESEDTQPSDFQRMISILSISNPAERVILADACQMDGGNPHATLYSVSGIWTKYPNTVGDDPVARGPDSDNSGGYLRWRAANGEGVKCLFVDGHVQVMLEGDLLQKHFQADAN
jgi:prepilin-type N-terminal cleavage/methylation domain-containing protein